MNLSILVENLVNPYAQLSVFCAVLLLVSFVKRFDSADILTVGTMGALFWLVTASFFGVKSSIGWSYYLHLLVALVLGYSLLIILLAVSEKWGRSYAGEGFIAVLAPVIWLPLIFILSAILKLILRAW